MRIITDSPTLYSSEEGKKIGITVIPACTIIEGEVYKDFDDIDSETFLGKIEAGAVPTTSQPAIGDMLEIFEESEEELLVLPIGDGLSGTYQNAVGAKNSIDDNAHIHVLNTKTLAGAQRYLIKKAMALKEKGLDIAKIKEELEKCIETSVSFVIPEDFEFLRRSGRLTPIAAKFATMIKIVPVLTQTEDKERITLFTVKRSKKKALQAIVEHIKALGEAGDYYITVAHTGITNEVKEVFAKVKEQFGEAETELLQLAPSLITHGGPGCVVIQAIHK